MHMVAADETLIVWMRSFAGNVLICNRPAIAVNKSAPLFENAASFVWSRAEERISNASSMERGLS